jgi:hypothetical protein
MIFLFFSKKEELKWNVLCVMEKKYARHVTEEGVLIKDLKVLRPKNAMHAMGIKLEDY